MTPFGFACLYAEHLHRSGIFTGRQACLYAQADKLRVKMTNYELQLAT
jgi:hypothetical protein